MNFFLFFCVLFGFGYSEDLPFHRLSHKAFPKAYDLKIRPIINENIFHGEVIIFIDVLDIIPNITLNSRTLEIHNIALDSKIDETRYELDPDYELLTVFFNDTNQIDPGEHYLYVNFSGTIRPGGISTEESAIALFNSSITDSKGNYIDGVATMFSASHARKVFPCFDDPYFKSKFTIRLIKPNENYTALSNMEEINSFKTNQGIAVDFRTTPPISTYFLCFALTKYKFSSINYKSIDGRMIPLKLYQLDEYLDQAPFLLDAAEKALKFFEEYTNISYPLDKLDFIELPGFPFEGMENMGLITLEHNVVSFNASNDKMNKITHLQEAAALMVHEVAHMWFGDIATHFWYSDLWLNEGFATFMTVKSVHHQHLDWQHVETEAIIGRSVHYYTNDILPKIFNPVVTFPDTHQEIELQFDYSMVYTKGSAILGMLEMVMGENTFKNAVREHLKKNYLKLVTTGGFIETMQEFVPKINIWGFLETWLYQNRYPLVVINEDKNNSKYILTQRNFVDEGDSVSVFKYKWTIPISFVSNCNKEKQLIWFDKDATEVSIQKCKGQKWIKLNHNAVGYYRVLYSNELYENLLENFEDLKEADQANLIDETYHLTKTLKIPSKNNFLKILKKMKGRKTFLPIFETFRALKSLRDKKLMKETSLDIFKNLYKELRWIVNKGDTFVTRMLRTMVLDLLCTQPIYYEKCLEDVEELLKNKTVLHSDVKKYFKIVLKDAPFYKVKDNTTLVDNKTEEGKL